MMLRKFLLTHQPQEEGGGALVGVGSLSLHCMPRFLLQPLLKRCKFDDTCGVNNLHGLPGLIAGLGGIVVAYMADDDKYGPRYGAEKPSITN